MSLTSYELAHIKKLIDAAQKKTELEMSTLRDSFAGLTEAVKELAGEVRALRADMNPQLDKPRKLPQPTQGA